MQAQKLEVKDQKKFPLAVYCAIFLTTKIFFKGAELKVERTTRGLRKVRHAGMLCIEQNPSTKSRFAKRAQKGSKIMWIINEKTGEYLARVENGLVSRC